MKFNLDEAITILQKTPIVLLAMLADLDQKWTDQNEGNETWSPYDIIGHLIHGEKTDWIPRLKIILSNNEDKTFEPFDRFAQFHKHHEISLKERLNEFAELRNRNLKELNQLELKASDFEKKAIHPELGTVNLSELLATWVTHDLSHIAQICRVMAKQYREEVGPWRAYIPILDK